MHNSGLPDAIASPRSFMSSRIPDASSNRFPYADQFHFISRLMPEFTAGGQQNTPHENPVGA
jgi:hypothetical protein